MDVGNKSLGLEALMNHLACTPSEVGAALRLAGRALAGWLWDGACCLVALGAPVPNRLLAAESWQASGRRG